MTTAPSHRECPDCNGSGKASCMSCRGSSLLPITLTECPWCHNGLLTCDTCDGTGKAEEDEPLQWLEERAKVVPEFVPTEVQSVEWNDGHMTKEVA